VLTDNGVSKTNPRLVHLPEVATATIAPMPVPTEPTLGEAGGGGGFGECQMAVAPNGVIYLRVGSQIWKVGL
jgi:hypothetical protein